MGKAKSARPGTAARAASAGAKKQRKQAGNVAALQAILAQTRAAQRRLLTLAARLRNAEQAILVALGGGPEGTPAATRARRRVTTQTKPAVPSANGRRRPVKPL
jgi:hypothetical protein